MTVKSRKAKYLWIAAVGAVLVLPAVPAAAVIPVTVDFDATGSAGWIAQAANMAKTLANDYNRYVQLEHEIQDADTELKQLKSMAHNSTGSMQNFTNFVVTANKEYPTQAGSQVASAIVASQNGSLASSTLGSLTSEVLSSSGGLQAQAAQEDVMLHVLAQQEVQTQLAATQELQEHAYVQQASQQVGNLLDTQGPPLQNFGF